MNEHPETQDKLYVRGLLSEAGVEESPDLVEQLLALRMQSRVPAPEPDGELAALFAGNPVPLRPRVRRGRGIILGAALIGAMGVGAGGVAANPDFLIRADPRPEVTFTPEAPTLQRSEPAAPEAVPDPLPAAAVPAAEPAPTAAAVPVPAPVPEPEPEPEPEQAPASAILPAPGVKPGNPPVPVIGGGQGIVRDPPRGDDLHEGANAGGRAANGAGANLAGDRESSRQDSRQDSDAGSDKDKGRGNGGAGSPGRGSRHRDR
ncbi:hypothetical protein NNX39_06780 [Arthrobacter sp. zg-Y826]|uniref:hypothetical protein n=1 Tax=Arthrobacter jinronghuae TaxID=2964609 RepID=UPI00210262CD|nr:hypothetical protein [Arthrobacter jinronghuae]MCQ1956210.1 hypothetical protein [Arthrobacter jinronghuae]